MAEDPIVSVRAALWVARAGLTTTGLVQRTGLSMLQVLRALQVLLQRGLVRAVGLTYISTE